MEERIIENTIWNSGCACGHYETPDVKAYVSCRKSNGSRDYAGDIVDYKVIGNKEIAQRDLGFLISIIGAEHTIDFVVNKNDEIYKH